MMLATRDIDKYLIFDKKNRKGGMLFVGQGVATKEEIRDLKRYDDAYLENIGIHYINNYEELVTDEK